MTSESAAPEGTTTSFTPNVEQALANAALDTAELGVASPGLVPPQQAKFLLFLPGYVADWAGFGVSATGAFKPKSSPSW